MMEAFTIVTMLVLLGCFVRFLDYVRDLQKWVVNLDAAEQATRYDLVNVVERLDHLDARQNYQQTQQGHQQTQVEGLRARLEALELARDRSVPDRSLTPPGMDLPISLISLISAGPAAHEELRHVALAMPPAPDWLDDTFGQNPNDRAALARWFQQYADLRARARKAAQ